jgi:hypothetical protein
MNEFTTMYQYFKEFSKSSPEEGIVQLKSDLPPTEECTNDSYPTHYLEMKSNSDHPRERKCDGERQLFEYRCRFIGYGFI